MATIASFDDVALNFDKTKLTELVDASAVPANTPGATPAEKAQNVGASLHRKLFLDQPSGVLQRMITNNELPVVVVENCG